ncbi:MAG: RraA family protein [Candidatus Anammoximicrobium sp.]|nr:RraA family protein [Candidatus Anammoximicrobium sp.]
MPQENLFQQEAKMMKLEALIAERESISSKPFPVPVPELLQRYEQLYTGAINDVLREFCLLEQALPYDIVPLRDQDTVAGIAFTVKSSPHCVIRGEMTFRAQMLDEMHADAFVVWDTSRDEKATLWGGVMTATAKAKQVRAACIDGGIRDTHQILAQDFPVYYRYRTSNGSLSRCQITHYQVPIKLGDVTIKPGDVILADIDGVLCVPRDIAYDVLLRAEEIRVNEQKIFGWVAEGQTIHEITEKGGYF